MRPLTSPRPDGVFYPESDGKPMADNTRQFRWIVTLAGNLAALFRDDPDVFVSGNQFWYPVEGEPAIVIAPDVYVVFGRPKGERPSWKQWEEGGVPMTVVFEVLSPANDASEMADKFVFYDEYAVEEYYVYDPDRNRLHGYVRAAATLAPIRRINGFVSPRLGIRFDLSGTVLVVRYPDGRPFLTFEELEAERVALASRVERAELRAEAAELQSEQDRERAEAAEHHAAQLQQRTEELERRSREGVRRARRLMDLSEKILHATATPEEREEFAALLRGDAPSASAAPGE
jgi:Uma2 family endonuclease